MECSLMRSLNRLHSSSITATMSISLEMSGKLRAGEGGDKLNSLVNALDAQVDALAEAVANILVVEAQLSATRVAMLPASLRIA